MKTIKQLLLLSTVLTLFVTTGCIDDFSIRGNGIVESESRYAKNFEKVKTSGPFDIYISNSDEYEVIVSAETNILPYIEVEVTNKTLYIGTKGLHNLRNTEPMEIFISTPCLEGIKQSGSGEVVTDFFESNDFDLCLSGSGYIETAIKCNSLEAKLSGSGEMYISGDADYSELKVSGSGEINSYDLLAKKCNANISGSGEVFVNVKNLLNAKISGSGNIYFIGDPVIISNISGSGSIIDTNE